MKLWKKLTTVTLSLLFTVLIIACSQEEKKKEISILYPNWADGVAITNLAKVALEDMGYKVNITPLEPGPIYATLAKGDADLFLDSWLPHTHKDYWEKYGDKLDKVGISFDNGTTGLVVPTYVNIDSITQLNDNKDKFDGKIIGIGSGAGIHRNTEKAIEEYELDYKQITSSGPAMMASLKKSYKNEEPIIVTGWKPHYMWAKYDLKYLEDPKGIYPKDKCTILAREKFREENPDVGEFFSDFKLTEKQFNSLMNVIQEGEDEEEAARKWYEDNKVVIKSWMPGE